MSFKNYNKHSKEFLLLFEEETPINIAIKTITHNKPIFVFWVSPNGEVIDAKDAHHKNPPNKDKSVLSDKKHKGYLRGRAAFIGGKIYIVIYGMKDKELSIYQLALLKRSYPRLLDEIKNRITNKKLIDSAIFITEMGSVIEI